MIAIAPRRRAITEYLDRPDAPPDDVAANLRDLRRLNHLFGGYRYATTHLAELLRAADRSRPLRILDAGVGGGDVALAVAAWARQRGLLVLIRGVDLSPAVADYARRAVAADPAIEIEEANVLALDAREGAFDVSLSTLLLHHLTAEEGVRLLQLLDRVSRLGFVVVDLVRSWAGYAGVWLATRGLLMSAATRHDGPASVLRSFTLPELGEMIAASGVRGIRVVRHPLFRVALVKRRGGAA